MCAETFSKELKCENVYTIYRTVVGEKELHSVLKAETSAVAVSNANLTNLALMGDVDHAL